jgi:hypothetical protein
MWSEVLVYCVPFRDQGAWIGAAGRSSRIGRLEARGHIVGVGGPFPAPALTAAQALGAVSVSAGDHVLVAGAGGVTGELLVRLALARGALRVAVAAADSLRHASEALASAASGRAGGAIALRPPDSTA